MARQKENTEKIMVFLPLEAVEKLKANANEKGMTISGFVRMIILEYLKNK